MGGWLSFLWPFKGVEPHRIIILGLDGAGKTTLLFRLRVGEVTQTVPTVGFNLETLHYKNVTFMMWDVGGQDKIRNLWKHYFENTEAVVWVIDSADQARLAESKAELFRVLQDEAIQSVPLLIFANKQDLPTALPAAQIVEQFDLRTLEGKRTVHIQPAVATEGQGLFEGLDWLAQSLLKPKK